jgi:hypothetical protein
LSLSVELGFFLFGHLGPFAIRLAFGLKSLLAEYVRSNVTHCSYIALARREEQSILSSATGGLYVPGMIRDAAFNV